MDSQKEEGPAPLLWRFSDFLKWAELCPSEPEIGHALMRLVITGQEIPLACEVFSCYINYRTFCGDKSIKLVKKYTNVCHAETFLGIYGTITKRVLMSWLPSFF